MADWCPKCHAMLSPGQENCPVCGALLPKPGKPDFTNKDVLAFSLYFLSIALIPILFIVGIGLICVLLNR